MKLAALAHLPRDARDTLFLLAVIGWVMAPLLPELPPWCGGLAAAVLVWRGVLAWRGQPLPGWRWRLALLALAVGATLMSFKTLLGRDAGVTLVVVLLALKTLELRAQRDAFVVFFLGFFLMLTHFFYSQSLLTAAAILLALWGLLTALVNAHMPVGRPPLWQAARTAGGMTLLGAPVMVALFLLFPRMAPLWGLPGDAMAGRSGLSGQMTVGNIASLALDDSVALRIRFDDAPPAQDQLYFRGPVLSQFDGRTWRHTEALALLQPQRAGLQVYGRAIRYQITLEPNQRPWLLTLDATAQAPELPPAHSPRMTSELQWLQMHNVTELLRYRASSHPEFRHGLQASGAQLAAYLVLPDGFNPRTRALAQDLLQSAAAQANPAQAVVQAGLERLRTGGYVYTLEPGLYGRDSADEFWFDRKTGFCEHMAASFVILMRAAGIPSRVVTGYQGGQRNPVDGFWTVRQSDAHAWTEVWLAGQGWVRVDPTSAVAPSRTGSFNRLVTPGGALANAILGTVNPRLALNLRALWDAANNRWNQWVLNYSQSSQMDLLRRLGVQAPSWEDLVYLMCGLLVLANLAAAAWNAWDRRRQDPWLRLLDQAQARLLGTPPPGATRLTPRQLIERLRDAPDPQASAWRDWLLRLEAWRYAPPHAAAPRPTDLRQLRHELRSLRWREGQCPLP